MRMVSSLLATTRGSSWERTASASSGPGRRAVDAFELREPLGRGAFSEVWRVVLASAPSSPLRTEPFFATGRHASRDTWALKVVHARRLAAADRALLASETAIWASLDHPNVMALELFFQVGDVRYFLSEEMDESMLDMHNRMLRLGAKPRTVTICSNLLQVARGLAYLHAKAIVHRDVKSANVLVRNHGELVRLGDFGLARVVASADMTAETGSYRWMAPEVVRHERYDERCDVYSLAMLMYECLTLSVPFSVFSPVEVALAVAKHGRRPALPPTSEEMRRLVESAWAQDPSERPSCEDVCRALRTMLDLKKSFGALEVAKLVSSKSCPDLHLLH